MPPLTSRKIFLPAPRGSSSRFSQPLLPGISPTKATKPAKRRTAEIPNITEEQIQTAVVRVVRGDHRLVPCVPETTEMAGIRGWMRPGPRGFADPQPREPWEMAEMDRFCLDGDGDQGSEDAVYPVHHTRREGPPAAGICGRQERPGVPVARCRGGARNGLCLPAVALFAGAFVGWFEKAFLSGLGMSSFDLFYRGGLVLLIAVCTYAWTQAILTLLVRRSRHLTEISSINRAGQLYLSGIIDRDRFR